jgi:hypothetical protein
VRLASAPAAEAERAGALLTRAALRRKPRTDAAGVSRAIVSNHGRSAARPHLAEGSAVHQNVIIFSKKCLTEKPGVSISAQLAALERSATVVPLVINANDQTSHLLRGGLERLWSFFEPK